jgi:hypothetical protein
LLPFIASLLQQIDRKLVRGALAGTIVVGVVVYALSSATFPYWPDSMQHPMFDCMFHLFVDNQVAPNAGNVVGLHGIASVLPYFLLVAGLLGFAIQRVCGWRGLAIAIAIGIAFFVAASALPYGEPKARSAYRFVHMVVNEQ